METKRLTIGGQAVIEGVMMKSPRWVSTSVRKTSGEIVSKVEAYQSLSSRSKLLRLPIVRGAVNLFEQLFLGIKSLTYSAEVVSSDDETVRGTSNWKFSLSAGLTVVVAFALGLLLFFYLPLVIANHVGAKGSIVFNLVDGLVRLGFFFAYLGMLSFWKEMRRVFEYHGAEHKSIHAYEHGETLDVESVKKYTTRHARCGTSFLLVVMVVSIVVFIFMGRPESVGERLLRLCAVPLIAGISYEIIRLAGKKHDWLLVKIISAPGLALQRFTTREPSDDQLEVALDALKNALKAEVGV